MRLFLLIGFLAINLLGLKAQLISYSLHEGDTINAIDKDSLKQGVWRSFWPNGKLSSEVIYRNNKKHGLEISWYNHSNCVKQETFYNNGQLDGPVTFYNKDCNKEFIENYKNGVKEGMELSYYANGRIQAEGYYKKGNLDGVYKVYTKSGKFDFESRSTTGPIEFEPDIEDTANNSVYKILKRNPKWKKILL